MRVHVGLSERIIDFFRQNEFVQCPAQRTEKYSMGKKLQKFGIIMGQRYEIFRKKKKIWRNIMKLENKYKSTRNNIRIISLCYIM